MQVQKNVALLGGGMLLRCGAATTIPASFAATPSGSWDCYSMHDIDEKDLGRNEDARNYEMGPQ